ncbi:MAG TPA: SMC-Scp complex subunit ScpB [Gammaproteobacteria bacterium]|nr:SMC-Scp complex subunit ScpB [Gammaproteobacteria bacterium]
MPIDTDKLKAIVEAALLAAARPLNLDQLSSLFNDDEKPEKADLRNALKALAEDFSDRSVELKEVASGWRVQVRAEYAQWTSRLWEERPTRYSRALLETLALVAYRQPITRGEIEDVRGVSVSTNIIKTMLDRNWIRIVGHRDVPGRPAMFGTTRDFLDYFGLKSLDELPTLAELRDIDSINVELDFDGPQVASAEAQSNDDLLPEAANHETQEDNEQSLDHSRDDDWEKTGAENRNDGEESADENPSENPDKENRQTGNPDDEIESRQATSNQATGIEDAAHFNENADSVESPATENNKDPQ